jgi:hypothetical protein
MKHVTIAVLAIWAALACGVLLGIVATLIATA